MHNPILISHIQYSLSYVTTSFLTFRIPYPVSGTPLSISQFDNCTLSLHLDVREILHNIPEKIFFPQNLKYGLQISYKKAALTTNEIAIPQNEIRCPQDPHNTHKELAFVQPKIDISQNVIRCPQISHKTHK